jgi:type VI secretion system protein ImpL
MTIPSPSSILSRLGRFVVGAATSYLTRSAIVVIGVALAIWYFGPQLKYQDYTPFGPVLNRVVAIAVVIFLWGVNNLFAARRQARLKPKIEKAEAVARDPVEEEIAELRQSFRNAMKIVREKWSGRERGGDVLYAMPWFLAFGAGGVGKTSLIVDADLKFPLGPLLGLENFKNVRATSKPQYWVTNESIVFDLPGQWLEQDAVSDEAPAPGETVAATRETRLWRAFMALLVEFRPRRPINGVLLFLDTVEVLKATDDRRANMAAGIHGRLVELSDNLGTRFTVHAIFTKLDRLVGFRDYFSQFTRAERASPFGFSFKIHDEVEADGWIKELKQAYERFMKTVNDDMIDRLYTQRETQSRRNIFIFSRELAALGPIVSDFLGFCLHADRFSTPPLVRGVYFASARQEGVPFNALLARISREYDMPPPILPAYSGQSAPVFSAELFPRVFFREGGLAGDNKTVENRKRLALNASILLGVIGLLGLGFFLNQAEEDNIRRSGRVVERIKAFEATPLTDLNVRDVAAWTPALNAIRAADEEFPRWRDALPALRYTALYQGLRVGPEVEKVYDGLLRERFLPAAASTLKEELVRMGAEKDRATSDERLDTLRTYLLLGSLERRREVDARADFGAEGAGAATVLSWFSRDWQGRYEGQKQLQGDLAQHMTHALTIANLTAKLDPDTINAAQTDLRKVPRDLRLYRGIELLSQRQMPTGVSFRAEIGPSYDLIFKQSNETANKAKDVAIASYFTKKGYLDFFVPQNASLSTVAVEDAWVTGEREHVVYSPEDLEAFRKKVRQRYSTAYIDQWNGAIDGMEIVDFQNLDHAIAVLAEINGPANPLGRLLNLVKANTEIYEQKPVEVDKTNPAAANAAVMPFDDNREQGLRIARYFSQLNQVTSAKEKEKPLFEELMGAMQRLEVYMRDIKAGIDSGKPMALQRARERANLQGDDPIYVLRRISANLPEPLNRHFTKIADECWKVILEEAKKNLQTVWQQKVYNRYNVDLATRYPFRRDAKDEVKIEEFEGFFGPNGAFETFFSENLKPFVNENTSEPIVIDGQSLRVSDAFLVQLKKVRRIRDMFFDGKGAASLRYSVEPISLTQDLANTVLNIDGQLVRYSHGPTRPTAILWPNALSSQQNISQLSAFGVSGQSSTAALTFQGLWSGFRLMDHGHISHAQPGGADITFDVAGGKALYRITVSTPENPFATQPLSTLRLPETLGAT